MQNNSSSARYGTLIAILILAACTLPQSACFSKKVKPEAVVGAPVRLALLPFNVPPEKKDLHWIAFAAPIIMAKAGENAEGLNLIPLWETMPVALNMGGPSRTFTPETAADAASWLNAKWVALGEISPTKTGISLTVDFIPARANIVPFRYTKSGKPDIVGADFPTAFNQFLRYLVARPLAPSRGDELTMTGAKELAEALDREYGWFVEAQPGKAQDVVASLMRKDDRLVRFLFSPSLYPILAEKK